MALLQKQEYESEILPDQRRQEDQKLARDRDLENAFVRWKRIAYGSITVLAIMSFMALVFFFAACFFAWKWYTVVPMPVVFHHNAEGEIFLGQVGWPEPNPTVEKTKGGLANLFYHMRRVSFDESITAENLNRVPSFLTPRAQNLLAAFNQQHPLNKFYENKYARRVVKGSFDIKQDPNTKSLFYVKWTEQILNERGSLVRGPVTVTATVWTVPNATCPRTLQQMAANPDCIVVDSFEWNALN